MGLVGVGLICAPGTNLMMTRRNAWNPRAYLSRRSGLSGSSNQLDASFDPIGAGSQAHEVDAGASAAAPVVLPGPSDSVCSGGQHRVRECGDTPAPDIEHFDAHVLRFVEYELDSRLDPKRIRPTRQLSG